jgi:predicted kinase
MKLIVFSGLLGTGKSTIAEAVGKELGIPVFAKDWLEGALKNSNLVTATTEKYLGSAGYTLLTVLAERQLMLGQSVILDSVTSTASIRLAWKNLCRKYEADWRVIECVCSDDSIHQARLKQRQRGIPGWHELEWADVERVRSYYVPWRENRLVLDMILSFDKNIFAALDYCK